MRQNRAAISRVMAFCACPRFSLVTGQGNGQIALAVGMPVPRACSLPVARRIHFHVVEISRKAEPRLPYACKLLKKMIL